MKVGCAVYNSGEDGSLGLGLLYNVWKSRRQGIGTRRMGFSMGFSMCLSSVDAWIFIDSVGDLWREKLDRNEREIGCGNLA